MSSQKAPNMALLLFHSQENYYTPVFVVTRCQVIRLKCTKFNFVCGSAAYPTRGAYSAPPFPLAEFKGPTSKGREGKSWE